MRDDLKFMRKRRWLDFVIAKTPDVSVDEALQLFDRLTLSDEIVIPLSFHFDDGLTLRDWLCFDFFVPDTLSLSDQLIANLHPPLIIVDLTDAIQFTDSVKSEVAKAITDVINISDTLLIEYERTLLDNLSLSDAISTSTSTVTQSQVTVTDNLNLSDTLVIDVFFII